MPGGACLGGGKDDKPISKVGEAAYLNDASPKKSTQITVGVIFYSTHGHTYKLAQALAEGARAGGANVELRRVAETLPDVVIGKMGGLDLRKEWWNIPVVTPEDLKRYDAIALGGGTRYGIPSAQLKAFIDSLGGIWMTDAVAGRFATVFGCSSSQHGGNETNLLFTMLPLFHLGYSIVGLPYTYKGQGETNQIAGGSPYGITSLSLSGTRHDPLKSEIDGAVYQGRNLIHVMTGKPPVKG